MGLTTDDTAWLRTVGMRVRLTRVVRGDSQEQLGRRAGVSRVTVGSIERGDHPAAVTTYRRLSNALDVDLGQLLRPLGGAEPILIACDDGQRLLQTN